MPQEYFFCQMCVFKQLCFLHLDNKVPQKSTQKCLPSLLIMYACLINHTSLCFLWIHDIIQRLFVVLLLRHFIISLSPAAFFEVPSKVTVLLWPYRVPETKFLDLASDT